MKIGIIGTGNMGRSIGIVWQRLGHEVFFGARDLDKSALAASLSPGSQSGSNDGAAAFGELLLYTPRNVPPSEVLSDITVVTKKIVLDCSNHQVAADLLFSPISFSNAEELPQQLPGARIVKAFNTLPQEVFELCPNAVRPYQVAAFVASDDDAARATVLHLATEMGFHAVDCGSLHQARLLESAGNLIRLVIKSEGLGVNFAIVKPPAPSIPTLGGRQASHLK